MHRYSIGMFAIACGLVATATTAQAAIETWVSGTGTDAGNCPITAPCRTFAYAHGQTNNNGAINVLTSGNFGPVTINKPISIVADGVEAVINSGLGGAGIVVQAAGGAVVSLRGLTIDLRGTNNTGILFLSGAALHVHDSVIRRTITAIHFAPSSGTSELYVANSVIADVSGNGISVNPSGSGSVRAVIDRVRVERGQFTGMTFVGVETTGAVVANVRDSVVAGNNSHGIGAFGDPGTTTVMVDRTTSINNADRGIFAFGAGATVRIGDSTVSGNNFGLTFASGGTIESYETNKVNGNGTDGAPSSTIAMK